MRFLFRFTTRGSLSDARSGVDGEGSNPGELTTGPEARRAPRPGCAGRSAKGVSATPLAGDTRVHELDRADDGGGTSTYDESFPVADAATCACSAG